MHRSTSLWIAPLILAFLFPVAALADLNQTTVLTSGTAINLDTGNLNAATNDLLWDGTTFTPQGNATAVRMYRGWPIDFFGTISFITVQLVPGYAKTSISGMQVQDVIGVHTNGNHWSKLIVTAINGSTITVQLTTNGVSQGNGSGNNGAPTISSVQNNSSSIGDGLPNSGIAPSSIFVVVGSALSDPVVPVLHDTAGLGLPTTLNGATVTVKVGATSLQTPLYYTSPTQLAGVLPAATPIGNGTLTVSYKGVNSNAFAIKVVPAALGFNKYNGNIAVATDAYTGALMTVSNSAVPGEYLVVWTTGLGADPLDSDSVYIDSPHVINTPLHLFLNGAEIPVLYQSSSTYPGVDVLLIQVPQDAPNGCWVSLAATAGGVASNSVTLPINSTAGACVDTVTGFTTAQLTAGATGTLRTGFVSLVQTHTTNNGVPTVSNAGNAVFRTYSGVYTPSNQISPGGCIVNDQTPVSTDNTTGLTPGALTLTGPGLSAPLSSQFGIQGAYTALLSSTAIPNSGGTFTFTGAAGGADVGPFTSIVTLANPLLSWTNQNAATSIIRSQGLDVNWSGGNPGSIVIVTGTSTVSGGITGAGFTCMASVAAGHLTVPPHILAALPAGNSGVTIQNDVYFPLQASGLDIAFGLADIATTVNGTMQ